MSGSAALSPARFFEPDRILKVLAEHGVRYVLVGGIAATLRGSPSMTYDIDVAPELSSDNLERLAAALRDLGAGQEFLELVSAWNRIQRVAALPGVNEQPPAWTVNVETRRVQSPVERLDAQLDRVCQATRIDVERGAQTA